MLTLPPDEMLAGWLIQPQRAPSGNLSPSSDILAPLRHVQLKVAGAPKREDADSLLGFVRMETGTLWHSHFERIFKRRRLPVMLEVRLNDYLPEGWAGIADWIMWSDEYRAFVLGDLKTAKPESMLRLGQYGIKEAHMWQLSAYWYALEKMGIPLLNSFLCMYLPMDDSVAGVTAPLVIEGRPLARDLVIGTMTQRTEDVRRYLASLTSLDDGRLAYGVDDPLYFITDELAPAQERIQKVSWVGDKYHYEVKLAPHWSATYCPYPVELCDCSTQKANKIGQWEFHPDTGEIAYVARKGYETVKPVELSAGQIRKMKEEIARARSNANE